VSLGDINLLYSLAGLAVGILVGLTGVGGGSLMTPLLVLAFGFHPVTAVGTDLLYASATKTVGTTVHGISGTVDWKVVRRLATGSVPPLEARQILVPGIGATHVGTAAGAATSRSRETEEGSDRERAHAVGDAWLRELEAAVRAQWATLAGP